MIDAGLAVVLATDFNPGSSPTPSMPMVLSLASTHMRMTPPESITAATINAAYSLNRGDQIGSLESGKIADFVIHDCNDYREVAYFFGIEHAWRFSRADGKRLLVVVSSVTNLRPLHSTHRTRDLTGNQKNHLTAQLFYFIIDSTLERSDQKYWFLSTVMGCGLTC